MLRMKFTELFFPGHYNFIFCTPYLDASWGMEETDAKQSCLSVSIVLHSPHKLFPRKFHIILGQLNDGQTLLQYV